MNKNRKYHPENDLTENIQASCVILHKNVELGGHSQVLGLNEIGVKIGHILIFLLQALQGLSSIKI